MWGMMGAEETQQVAPLQQGRETLLGNFLRRRIWREAHLGAVGEGVGGI